MKINEEEYDVAPMFAKQLVEYLDIYYFLQYLKNNDKEQILNNLNTNFKQLNSRIEESILNTSKSKFFDIEILSKLDLLKYEMFLDERNK